MKNLICIVVLCTISIPCFSQEPDIKINALLGYMGKDYMNVNNMVLFTDFKIDRNLPKSGNRAQRIYSCNFGILYIFYNEKDDGVNEIRLFCDNEDFAKESMSLLIANEFTVDKEDKKDMRIVTFTKKFDDWYMHVEVFLFSNGSIEYDLIESDK